MRRPRPCQVCASSGVDWINSKLAEGHTSECIAWEALRRDCLVWSRHIAQHQERCLQDPVTRMPLDIGPWWYVPPPVSVGFNDPLELLVIRGLPGTGKTRYARLFERTHFHVEQDHYHMSRDGAFSFHASTHPEAVLWCQYATHEALSAGNPVVVANTFVTNDTLGIYYYLAQSHGARVRVVNMPDQLPRSLRAAEEQGFTMFKRLSISRIGFMRNRWEVIAVPDEYRELPVSVEDAPLDARSLPLPEVPYFCQPGLCPHAEPFDFSLHWSLLRKHAELPIRAGYI